MTEFTIDSENARLQQCAHNPTLLELVVDRPGEPPLFLRIHKADFLDICAGFLEKFSDEVRPFLQTY